MAGINDGAGMGLDINALIPRRALTVARGRLGAARGIVINGPRQSGKTELMRGLHRETGGSLLSLDDSATLTAALADPGGIVTGFPSPVYIDEVQRGGDPLILAAKSTLDSSRAKGQIEMAGSTRFLTEPRLSESLAGRVRSYRDSSRRSPHS